MTPLIKNWPWLAERVFFTVLEKLPKTIRWRLDRSYEKALYWMATRHRQRLRRTVFVGVTGSVGKSTTKDLIAGILERHMKNGCKNSGSLNWAWDVAHLILRTKRSDAFCVTELAVTGPGTLDLSLSLVRPAVGVVTNIGDDHFSSFGNREAIAQEKSKLIKSLPSDGVAILNADDPRVQAMRSHFSGRVVTYGQGEGAMLRGEVVQSAWPDRLSLTVIWNGESVRVQTQFCGTFWTTAVLAAMATGISLGVPLAVAAEAIANVEPFEGRMAPVCVGEVTFIRDDWKAPLWTVAAVIEFVRQARAVRKIIIIGTLSDYQGNSTTRYAEVGKQALAAADCVIFVGSRAASGLRAKSSEKDELWAFPSLREASKFLAGYLKPGDLVLLKGSNKADHMQRLILASTTEVKCWRSDCGRSKFCDACELINVESGPVAANIDMAKSMPISSAESEMPVDELRRIGRSMVVVVGLGNPGESYIGTPHNVGYSTIDILAQGLARNWLQVDELAMVMRGESQNVSICLIKALTQMNQVGPALLRLAHVLDFGLAQCIFIHDDLDLPIGTVRVRMRGSDGGHRGLRSIIQAFQADNFCRIKIGVGRSEAAQQVADYVLTPFQPEQKEKVDTACRTAADRVFELIRQGQHRTVEPVPDRQNI